MSMHGGGVLCSAQAAGQARCRIKGGTKTFTKLHMCHSFDTETTPQVAKASDLKKGHMCAKTAVLGLTKSPPSSAATPSVGGQHSAMQDRSLPKEPHRRFLIVRSQVIAAACRRPLMPTKET